MSYDPNKHPPEPRLSQTIISVILFILSVLVVTMIGGLAIAIINDGEHLPFVKGTPPQLEWIADWLDNLLDGL